MSISFMKLCKFTFAALVTTFLGLTAHIFLLKFTSPMIQSMAQGHQFPGPEDYGPWIVSWAYITAFEQMLVMVAVYYFVGGLLTCNKFLKVLLFSFISLELHGNLIRMTIMNFIVANEAGLSSPLIYSLLSQLDKILSAVLIVSALVFICPVKKYNFANDRH